LFGTDLVKVLPYTGQMCCLHAEGVRELSPGWSVAEPWVIELIGAAL